ncbi:hypothetical protein CUR86_15575 [Salinicola acroporae]|uniref:RecC C-terminal domain-containing protein n=1 Tax=Salinicola acroporae TaxID=1541440 RepID=A0ABT6I8U4_9GAMM|nr:hypothetical protein [Salinicola acroporae]
MVPEIDVYAPYIEAVFGRLPADDPRHIPFTIADQIASEAHPMMVLILALLELPERRLGVSELLDALDVPAFRARFAIDEAELPRLRRWLSESGVRWGLSGAHRQTLGFPALHENSWAFGLERMLLGYSTGPLPPGPTGPLPPGGGHGSIPTDAAWQFDAIVPYDEVGGLEADLAGRLAELMQVVAAQCEALSGAATPGDWLMRLRSLMEALFAPTALDEHDVLARVDQALGRWQQSCELASFSQPIGLAVVRDALRAELDDGGLAQRFLAGKVNFATLMPMRAIPFRQVYLLGMNDGAYPRTRQPQDFDLMAQRPRPGDRSRRDDDRYLLLEALLSARERLTLSWVGFDQRDNTPRPPSVLIGELLDTLEQGWRPAGHPGDRPAVDDETALAARLIEAHPLQPFSRRYFQADDPRYTFDASWAPLHDTRDDTERDTGQNVTEPAPPQPPGEALGLADLQRLLRRPWSVYLGRLGVRFQDAEVPDEDSEPFVLDALEDHTVKRELLDAGRRGEPLAQMADRLRLTGRLPAAGFGLASIEPTLKRLETQLETWRRLTATASEREPPLLRFDATATDGVPPLALEARVEGLFTDEQGGWQLLTLETSHFGHFKPEGDGPWKKLGKPHRLHAGYLRWLLVNAAGESSCHWTAIFEDRCLDFPPLERLDARRRLTAWLASWWRAWYKPLPASGSWSARCGASAMPRRCKPWQRERRPNRHCGNVSARTTRPATTRSRRWSSGRAAWASSGVTSRRSRRPAAWPRAFATTSRCWRRCGRRRSAFISRGPTHDRQPRPCRCRDGRGGRPAGARRPAVDRATSDRGQCRHRQDLHPGGTLRSAGAGAATRARDGGFPVSVDAAGNSGGDLHRGRHRRAAWAYPRAPQAGAQLAAGQPRGPRRPGVGDPAGTAGGGGRGRLPGWSQAVGPGRAADGRGGDLHHSRLLPTDADPPRLRRRGAVLRRTAAGRTDAVGPNGGRLLAL